MKRDDVAFGVMAAAMAVFIGISAGALHDLECALATMDTKPPVAGVPYPYTGWPLVQYLEMGDIDGNGVTHAHILIQRGTDCISGVKFESTGQTVKTGTCTFTCMDCCVKDYVKH